MITDAHLSLCLPIASLERAQALGVWAWAGTLMLPEKPVSLDAMILGEKTVDQVRPDFQGKGAFDTHKQSLEVLRYPDPSAKRPEDVRILDLPFLYGNWAIDGGVWRTVQQAIPAFTFLNLFYWRMPHDMGRVETNHPRVTASTPADIRRLLIEELTNP